MRLFLLFLGIYICNCTCAQNRSIHLEKANWKQVVGKAKEEKKILFIDCNAVWCNPCKALAKNVFTRDAVADFYNANFVSVSYDIEKDKSPDFEDMPPIASIPLLLFVDPSTLKVIHGCLGAPDEEGMLELGRKALDKKLNLAGMRERYQGEERGEELIIPYLKVLKNMRYYNEYQSVIKEYFQGMTGGRLMIAENWDLFEKEVNNPLLSVFQLAWKEQRQIAEKIGVERVKKKLEETLILRVKNSVERADPQKLEESYQDLVDLKDYVSTLEWEKRDFSLFVLDWAVSVYQGNYDDVVTCLKHFIKKYEVTNGEVVEYVYIFCDKLKTGGTPKQILSGIKLLDQVLKKQKDAGMRSKLMYLKRDMLRAAGYEKEAMRVDTLATKILNPHFYDR